MDTSPLSAAAADLGEAAPAPAAPGPERSTGLARRALLVALGATLLLAAFSPLFRPGRLHVQDMYVDQLGYVTTARILVDTGELRNGVLMPSQILNPRFRPYMPGHFLALAASYALLGYGVFATLLPSLASYVLVALGLYLIGARLYGPRAGTLAAFLFAVQPAELVYAFTGMAELTFTLAGVAAFAAFVHLPRRVWAFAPPVLLALPFLFRETGALLVLPMAALVWRARGLLPALLSSGASVATLWAVNRWQIASGKTPASLAFVTEGKFNYYNAFPEPPPETGAGELFRAVLHNAGRNLEELGALLGDWPGELMPIGLVVLLVAAPALVVAGVRRWRSDPLPLAAGALLALVLVMAIALYDVRAHKLMRTALFTVPFLALGAAGALRPDARPPSSRSRPAVRYGLAALALLVSFAVCARAGERMTRRDAEMDGLTEELAALHDEELLIMGPPYLAPMYPVEHYPVLWSFYAANMRTYAEVQQRHTIGTILSRDRVPPKFLRALDLRYTRMLRVGDADYFVYQRVP